MRVRLLSDRWRHKAGDDYRYYVKDDEFDVANDTGAWLIKHGAAVDLDAEPAPEPQADEDSQPAPAPATEPQADDEELPERPLNAAKKELWEDYYRQVTKKDPPKGASKEDLIAEVG